MDGSGGGEQKQEGGEQDDGSEDGDGDGDQDRDNDGVDEDIEDADEDSEEEDMVSLKKVVIDGFFFRCCCIWSRLLERFIVVYCSGD